MLKQSLFLILGLFSVNVWAAVLTAESFFEQSFGDYSEELDRAKEENKKGIFIFFEMDECPFCARMKSTILNQQKVQHYYKQHFLSFMLDIEGDVEVTDFSGDTMKQKDFARKYRVRATPMMIFVNLDGKTAVRYTGAVSSVDEFLLLGKYYLDGEFKKTSFSRYKRQK